MARYVQSKHIICLHCNVNVFKYSVNANDYGNESEFGVIIFGFSIGVQLFGFCSCVCVCVCV